MTSKIFQKKITVQVEHLDDLKHVNNVVFLQWVQEIAGAHWRDRSSDDFNANYYWVVLNHYIEYKSQAFLGEEITVRTYVEKNHGIRSTRIVEFFKNDVLLVKAKTDWCLISRASHRPVRIPDEIDKLFFGNLQSE